MAHHFNAFIFAYMQKGLAYIITCLVIACMLSSCSTGNKFASSFGKRKYLKGYYMDMPSGINEPEIAVKPSSPLPITAISNHIYLTDARITVKSKNSVTVIPANSATAPTAKNVQANSSPVQRVVTKAISNSAPPADEKPVLADNKKEVNFWAIAGCVLAIVAAVLAAISGTFSLITIIIMSLAGLICIYGLFQNKFYYTWLSIIGLSIIIFLLVLIIY